MMIDLLAVESVKRQMDYRPSEADSLSKELKCLKDAQSRGIVKVVVDKKQSCSNETTCSRHHYQS